MVFCRRCAVDWLVVTILDKLVTCQSRGNDQKSDCASPEQHTNCFPPFHNHTESSPKSERKPGHVASSRSCESASSWMKTCTATWSGSHTLKCWMPTGRAKVSMTGRLGLLTLTLRDAECVVLLAGLLPLTSDSDADSLYDLEGKSKIVYY